MAEYIEREALMKFPIRRDHYDRKNGNEHFINGIETVIDYAENLPSADVAPVVHGRWIKEKNRDDFDSMKCTACNGLLLVRWHTRLDFFRYCPNCGARMDLEEPNETKET